MNIGDLIASLGVETKGLDAAIQHMQNFGNKVADVTGKVTSGFGGLKKPIETFGVNIKQFATDPLGTMKGGVDGLLTKMGPFATGLMGIGGAAAIGAKALFDLGAAAADEVESLDNLSAQTGLSTQKLQALAQISKEAGLEGLDLGRTIGSLNKQMAEGKGDFVDSLKAMNIEMTDLATGKPKDAITLLDEMRSQLLSIEDPTERVQVAQASLGGKLRDMIPLLLNSSEGLGDMTAELEKSGVVYDEMTTNKLRKFDEAMDKMDRMWTAVMNTIKGTVGAILGTAFEWFSKLGEKIGWFGEKLGWVGEKLGLVSPKMDNLTKSNQQLDKATQGTAKSTLTLSQFQENLAKNTEKSTKSTNSAEEQEKKWKAEQERLKGVMQKLDLEIYNHNEAVRMYQQNTEWAAMHTAGFEEEIEKFHQELKEGKYDLDEYIKKYPGWVDANGNIREGLGDVNDALLTTDGSLLTMGKDVEKVANKSEQEMNSLGQAIGNTLSKLTDTIADKVTKWAGPFQSFAKAAFQSLLSGLFNPLLNKLSSVGNAIGSWLGNLFSGKSGGFGGLASSIGSIFTGGKGAGGILGSLFGIGGGAATGVGSAGMSAGTAAYFSSLTGAGSAGAAGGAGGAAAGGGSSMLGSLGGFLTNPITIGAAAAAGLGYLGYKFATGPDSWDALEKEVSRDYGGVKIESGTIKSFVNALGMSESKAWDVRKNISSSPVMLQAIGQAAEQQGKMDAFLKSLEKMGTAWGEFNFRTPFEEGMKTGDWGALNKMWAETSKLGDTGFGSRVQGGSEVFFLADLADETSDSVVDLTTTTDTFTDSITTSTDAMSTLSESIVSFKDTIISAVDALTNAISSMSGTSASEPSYANGTDYVQRRHRAWLDPGEAVLTAAENRSRGISVRMGDINLSVSAESTDTLQKFRRDVLPALMQELVYGPNGLSEAIVKAYNRTKGAI